MDLSGFKARGGKLMLNHGRSDPRFPSKDIARYDPSLAAADLAGLLLVRGMGDGSGGRAANFSCQ